MAPALAGEYMRAPPSIFGIEQALHEIGGYFRTERDLSRLLSSNQFGFTRRVVEDPCLVGGIEKPSCLFKGSGATRTYLFERHVMTALENPQADSLDLQFDRTEIDVDKPYLEADRLRMRNE